MQFQEYLGEKIPKFFPVGPSFIFVFDEMFIEVPKFHETSPALKNFWLRAWIELIKHENRKYVTKIQYIVSSSNLNFLDYS